jgi:hypothetical protein
MAFALAVARHGLNALGMLLLTFLLVMTQTAFINSREQRFEAQDWRR